MNRPAMVELAADVIANAGWSAELRHGEAFSIASLAATIPIMLALARRKLAIAEGSRAVRGAPTRSLAIVWFLVKHGREAWRPGGPRLPLRRCPGARTGAAERR